MNFILPVLAALLQATSATLDKFILSIRNINYKTYVGVSFPLVFLFTLLIFGVFQPDFNFSLLYGFSGAVLFLSTLLSVATNIIYYRALHDDDLAEMQTIDILRFLPIILFSALFFTTERNLAVIILAVVATAAIYWSHRSHHHFKIAKHTVPFLLWSLTGVPIYHLATKFLLLSWNPISLELVRNFLMALVFLPLFFKNSNRIPKKALPPLLLTNFLTSAAWILYFFSYQSIGIVYTVLIFTLQPFLVYFSSIIFLKEKLDPKKLIGFVIAVVCVGVALALG